MISLFLYRAELSFGFSSPSFHGRIFTANLKFRRGAPDFSAGAPFQVRSMDFYIGSYTFLIFLSLPCNNMYYKDRPPFFNFLKIFLYIIIIIE